MKIEYSHKNVLCTNLMTDLDELVGLEQLPFLPVLLMWPYCASPRYPYHPIKLE